MAIIGLEGMYFRADHGFYPEEQLTGNDFIVDLFVEVNTDGAAFSDDLFQTVNYELIHHICLSEMRETSHLIETIAWRIGSRIQDQFPKVSGVKIKVSKLNPPLGHKVERASIELTLGSFQGTGSGGSDFSWFEEEEDDDDDY